MIQGLTPSMFNLLGRLGEIDAQAEMKERN